MADYSSLFTAGLFQLCPHDQQQQQQQRQQCPEQRRTASASPSAASRRSRRPTISEQYRSFLSFDVAESLRSLTLSRTTDSWSFSSWTNSSSLQPRIVTTIPEAKHSLETLRKASGSPDSTRSRCSRRSLPDPKPAPSSPLPAAPSALSSSTASSPVLPSQRLPSLPPPPPNFVPTAAPAYTPTLARSRSQRSRDAGITHSAPAPTTSDIDSLRTVSTNYRRTKRSDALARLEGRHLRHTRRDSDGVPALPPLPPLGDLDLSLPSLNILLPPTAPLVLDRKPTPPRQKKRDSKIKKRRVTTMLGTAAPTSFIPLMDMDIDPEADLINAGESVEPDVPVGEDIDPLAYAMSLESLSPPSMTLSMLFGPTDESPVSSTTTTRGRKANRKHGRETSKRFPRNFMDMGDSDSIWAPSSHSSHSASLSMGSIPIIV